MFSPDGRWYAYTSNETGDLNVFVRSWPDSNVVGQITSEGGRDPVWAADGSALYFRGPTQMMKASIRQTESFAWDTPQPLFLDKYVRAPMSLFQRNYGFDPIKKRFLMMKEVEAQVSNRPTEIRVVENWIEEIKQRFADADSSQ